MFMNAQTIRYVKDVSNINSGNGSTWATASNDLQLMIDLSNSGDEVWVAAGTYTPIWTANGYTGTPPFSYTPGTAEDRSFVLKSGVKVYGGFAGTESSLAERDFVANETVLHGGSTCYHVVISAGNVVMPVWMVLLSSMALLQGVVL